MTAPGADGAGGALPGRGHRPRAPAPDACSRPCYGPTWPGGAWRSPGAAV